MNIYLPSQCNHNFQIRKVGVLCYDHSKTHHYVISFPEHYILSREWRVFVDQFNSVYLYILETYIWSIPTNVMHIGRKTTLLHSHEFFSLYRRHMELSQKIYASSLYVIVAT